MQKFSILRHLRCIGRKSSTAFARESVVEREKFVRFVAFALKTSVEATSYLSLPLRVVLLGGAPQISGEFQTILN